MITAWTITLSVDDRGMWTWHAMNEYDSTEWNRAGGYASASDALADAAGWISRPGVAQ